MQCRWHDRQEAAIFASASQCVCWCFTLVQVVVLTASIMPFYAALRGGSSHRESFTITAAVHGAMSDDESSALVPLQSMGHTGDCLSLVGSAAGDID